MGFRLVPKSVTLNDLERCNGHYFALFRGIRQVSWPVSYKWLISAVDLLFVINEHYYYYYYYLSPDKCHKVHQLSTTDALCSSRQRSFLLFLCCYVKCTMCALFSTFRLCVCVRVRLCVLRCQKTQLVLYQLYLLNMVLCMFCMHVTTQAQLHKQLSYRRDTELQGGLVMAKSGTLELGDNT